MAINVRAIANKAVQAINPDVIANLLRSTGYTTAPTGKRTPTYATAPVVVQVQALAYSDLQQLDSLNIQGVRRAIYLQTQVMSVVRVQQAGGDLIVFADGTLPEGTTWLAVHVLERWSTWCKVAITLQDDQLSLSGGLVTDLSDPNNEVVVPAVLTGV